ncbi:MAG TPA: hypothetical protein VMC03_01485 [Streptosporangiaceae bacterium]|nr:hypothetical protein [Streptosporangiaceae bacterium]
MDWTSIASLATAGGTLVLAVATFASVKSANRAARAAERSLQAGLRPLLVPSRLDDGDQKVYFSGGKYVIVPGGRAIVTEQSGAILLAISLRNAAGGLAVLHGWRFYRHDIRGDMRPAPEDFTVQTRDLYVPGGDAGFWQGAFRDPADPAFEAAQQAIKERDVITIDLLYGDFEGGQRVITRFILRPGRDDVLISSAIRHWNVDRNDPR